MIVRRRVAFVLAAALLGAAAGQAAELPSQRGQSDKPKKAEPAKACNIAGNPGVLAPNGVVHLVCTATVPAPGVPIVFGPSVTPGCWVEYRFATEWVERISPAGRAVLDCWVNPRAVMR